MRTLDNEQQIIEKYPTISCYFIQHSEPTRFKVFITVHNDEPSPCGTGRMCWASLRTFISGQPESPLWGSDIEDNIKTPFRIFRDEKASQNMTTFRAHNLTPLVCDNYCQSSRCHVGACNTRGSPDPHVGCDNLVMYTTETWTRQIVVMAVWAPSVVQLRYRLPTLVLSHPGQKVTLTCFINFWTLVRQPLTTHLIQCECLPRLGT